MISNLNSQCTHLTDRMSFLITRKNHYPTSSSWISCSWTSMIWGRPLYPPSRCCWSITLHPHSYGPNDSTEQVVYNPHSTRPHQDPHHISIVPFYTQIHVRSIPSYDRYHLEIDQVDPWPKDLILFTTPPNVPLQRLNLLHLQVDQLPLEVPNQHHFGVLGTACRLEPFLHILSHLVSIHAHLRWLHFGLQ